MTDSLRNDIARYTQLFGPSGEEDLVIREFTNDIASLGVDAQVDRLGNVIVPLKQAAQGYPLVMVSAHLDEIGFVVRKIESDGFLRVHRVGGVHDRVIAGQRLTFKTDKGFVTGSVGIKAKHLSSAEELKSAVTVDESYVDVLVSGAKEVDELGIEVGTFGTFTGEFVEHESFIQAKALDDRVGVALLLELARRVQQDAPKAGVTLVATVQEEFSVRGGVTAARAIKPDLALCLDIAVATDTPDLSSYGDVRLGSGPAITRFTRANLNGIIPNPKLRQFAHDTAQKLSIPVQYAVLQGGLTDGSYMQYEAGGIPTLDVSFPTRYTHTPVETCSLADIHQLLELVYGMLCRIPKNFDLTRG